MIAPVAMAVASDAGVEKALAGLRSGVREVALSIRAADPREARAYALLRAVTWAEITEAPPATGGRTPMMAPPATRMTEFLAMQAAANWAELVAELEAFLSGSGLFWLDGQRMAHQGLLAMGPDFAPAARAVVRGVALAIERLPWLAALAFENGTPFADGATQSWLTREAAAGGGAGEAGGDAAPWVEGLEMARGLVQEGKLEDGLALLAREGAGAGSGRAQFQWRLAVARLCLETGHAAIALPVLRRAAADGATVVAWEPDAAGEAALLLHRCLTMADGGLNLDAADQAREVASAFSTLSWIDPVKAMRALKSMI